MNTRQLLSVGIDIGTTTTRVIFSHRSWLTAAVSQVPRYEFIKREISWQSPVFFTPVDKQGGLKEAELKTLISSNIRLRALRRKALILVPSLSPVKAQNPQRSPGGDGALPVAGRFCRRQRRAAS